MPQKICWIHVFPLCLRSCYLSLLFCCSFMILLCAVSLFFVRYVKSKSDQQLLHGLGYNDTSSCMPEEFNKGLPIVPCGLIAWSLFNDTYTFTRSKSELKVNRKNIAWKSDREHKFGKHVYPFNFQNGTLIGGGSLDPSTPVSISGKSSLIQQKNWPCYCLNLVAGNLFYTYFDEICLQKSFAPVLGHFCHCIQIKPISNCFSCFLLNCFLGNLLSIS